MELMAGPVTSVEPLEGPGAGSRGCRSPVRDLAGAVVRFAWPAAIAGLSVFATLQWSRIRLLNAIWLETRQGTGTLSQEFLAQYGAWYVWARLQGSVLSRGIVYSQDLHRAQRLWVAEVLGSTLGCWLAWAVALAAIIALRVARSRAVPYDLSAASRMTLAARALRSASAWSIAAAAASAAAVWYAGFDRLGQTRALTDGLLPSTAQGLVMLLAWGVLGALAAIALVRPALRAQAPAPETLVCTGCRYRVQGLRASVCPECDAPIPAHDPGSLPSARALHRAIMRRAVAGAALVALVLAAATLFSERVANWVLLRPPVIPWVSGPQCRLGERAARLKTIYGTVTLSAEREHAVAAPGEGWLVSWSLDPKPGARTLPHAGTFTVAPHPYGAVPPVRQETPFGPLWWWLSQDGRTLEFAYTSPIVDYAWP